VRHVKVDGGIGFDTKDAAKLAERAEEDGFAGIWCAETGHDPFLPLLLAAEHTERIELGTAIAVAFARNPMTMAAVANDLQMHSKGRFILGLGSQIKPHIEKRYSMQWSRPAARMREYVQALRAIWSTWNEGTKLAFRGDFYTHTLMTPMFSPEPNPYGPPRVFVAGVGGLMTEVAGEVADGFLVHGFTTERYLRDVTLPAIERGLESSGRSRGDIELSYPGMVVTGETPEKFEAAATAVKLQLAFYGSTPAYRPVLEHHGWGDLQAELNTLSKRGEWVKMAELIDDDVMSTFAAVGEPDEIPSIVLERFGDVIDRFSFYAPYLPDPRVWVEVYSKLNS
jgi:probable F420-dependent oxidoreductase